MENESLSPSSQELDKTAGKGRGYWILAVLGLISLGLLAVRPGSSASPPEQTPPSPQQQEALHLEVAPTPGPSVVETPTVTIRVKPLPRPAKPPRQVKPKKAPKRQPAPPPEPDSQPPKPKPYPKAKPRATKPRPISQGSTSVEAPTARSSQTSESSPAHSEVLLSGELSWNSLPAGGPKTNGHILLEIKPAAVAKPNKVKRNLVVLLDVSGSMRLPVEEILTPVILLINRLGPDDRCAVVTFSDRAKAFAAETSMAAYKRDVTPLTTANRTDLLVGLETAVGELRKGRFQNRVDQLVVLTDGLTLGPKGKRFKADHQRACLEVARQANIPITVFGYGSNCDRALLDQLAGNKGKFIYTTSVNQLLDSVMGDVIGLSGVLTRNNNLVVTLTPGLQVNRAYLLGPNGQALGKLRVHNHKLEIPLGDLSEGESIRIALEAVLPKGQTGLVEIAQAQVQYTKPDGSKASTAPAKVELRYTESWERPQRNPALGKIVTEIQYVEKGKTF